MGNPFQFVPPQSIVLVVMTPVCLLRFHSKIEIMVYSFFVSEGFGAKNNDHFSFTDCSRIFTSHSASASMLETKINIYLTRVLRVYRSIRQLVSNRGGVGPYLQYVGVSACDAGYTWRGHDVAHTVGVVGSEQVVLGKE